MLQCLIILGVTLAVLTVGVLLATNRFASVRALGWLLASVAAILLFLIALGSWRFGVSWEEGDRHRALLPTILFTVVPPAFLVTLFVRLFHRRRPARPAN